MSQPRPQIRYFLGGPAFHPVREQAEMLIAQGLHPDADHHRFDGPEVFDTLADAPCDLLVLMGLHWTGMNAQWAGSLTYQPITDAQLACFEAYIASGRPVLLFHGTIASFDDNPRFGELLGVQWVWGHTTHSPVQEHVVRICDHTHPITEGMEDYTLVDELYYNLKMDPTLHIQRLAEATWDAASHPMILAGQGGRVPGAGRLVYLANGHDMRAFACPAILQQWRNSVQWLLEK